MSVEIRVPTLGESIVEATVGKWMKNEGESVAIGDPLVELETDKVNMEVAATGAGVLQSIVKREGGTVGIQIVTLRNQAEKSRFEALFPEVQLDAVSDDPADEFVDESADRGYAPLLDSR